MDPTGPSQILPVLPPDESGLAAFFECFEALQEGEKKSDPLSALFKNIPPAGFKNTDGFKFHAQLLTVLHKTKSEIEHLLQKMETKEDPPVASPISSRETSNLKENGKPFPSKKAKSFETLAETSGKKALQILSKKEFPESKMNSPFAREREREPNSSASPSAAKQTLPEPPRNLARQNLLHLTLQQLVGALEMKILEKAPPAAILQKIKPLIDHLIVVVETQENMARPSPKLVQLVHFLGQTFSDMRQLSWPSLFKKASESASEPPTKTASSSQKGQVSEKGLRRFEMSSLETANSLGEQKKASSHLAAPAKGTSLPPSSTSTAALSNLFTEKSGTETKREMPREITPWAAPYTAPKSEPRLRIKLKKKPKSPWRRSEKEDREDDLP